jgi:hypothetical protein
MLLLLVGAGAIYLVLGRFALLVQTDPEDHKDGDQQNDGVPQIRFPYHFPGKIKQATGPRGLEFIGTFRPQPGRGLLV